MTNNWLTRTRLQPLVVLAGLSVLTLATLGVAPRALGAAQPNIVVIVADDLGYAEVTCANASRPQDIPTPNITSIARSGVCFSNGYVTCPVCSPTRAGLLTGRYQQRFGHEFNPGPVQAAAEVFGLPRDQSTLTDRLKKLGYATGMVGKWHLGNRDGYRPAQRGFDEFFGFLGGAHSYVNSNADQNNRVFRGDQPTSEAEYLTDAFGREAVAFIDRHKQAPFFLYLPFNAVHAPLQAPDKYRERFAMIQNQKRHTFAAMLSAMDDNIGRVLGKLRDEKLDANTLIFFIADNGGPTAQTSSSNVPLHGFKAQVWEGGIRVPLMVSWPGHIPAGKTYDPPVSSLDIVPTALAAAGAPPAADSGLDGVDLLGYLDGQRTGRPHEKLFWRFGPQWAIRSGDFKLVQAPQSAVQLFDLSKDVGEAHDLAGQKPEVVDELQRAYREWDAQLRAPLWQRQTGPAQNGKAKAKAKGTGKGKKRAAQAPSDL